MRTVKPPSGPAQEWPKEATCKTKTCNAVLSYDPVDVQYSDFGCPRDEGDVDMRFFVVCTYCRENIIIPEEALPDALRLELVARYRASHHR